MTNKRSEKPYIDLGACVPADHFRTVEAFDPFLKAPTEISVSVGLKEKTMKKLSFPVPWDGHLYAYLRVNENFKALCIGYGTTWRNVERAYLEDWDDRFMLILETDRPGEELGFSVTQEQGIRLLEDCLRIPAQRREK